MIIVYKNNKNDFDLDDVLENTRNPNSSHQFPAKRFGKHCGKFTNLIRHLNDKPIEIFRCAPILHE